MSEIVPSVIVSAVSPTWVPPPGAVLARSAPGRTPASVSVPNWPLPGAPLDAAVVLAPPDWPSVEVPSSDREQADGDRDQPDDDGDSDVAKACRTHLVFPPMPIGRC